MSNAIYAEITNQIIKQVEKGAMPWVKPWRVDASADKNIISQKPYQGINRLILGMTSMIRGFETPVWGTYKHWESLGAQVRKGEKGTKIVFFKPVAKSEPDAEGNEQKGYAVLKGYWVFNASQVDGIAIMKPETDNNAFQDVALAEERIVKTGAVIRHGGDAAFFAPSADAIQMPNKSSFDTESSYYATIFHELTHWSGAKHRLDRVFGKKFGDSKYAFEELVAEMGAAFLCQDHGIQGELRHAGYIANWLNCMREDSKAIFKAAALAQKAADYINQLDATQEQKAA